MQRFLTALCVIGGVGAGLSSAALAGGNSVADLVPTTDAIACGGGLAPPDCESLASGGASVSRLRGQYYLNVMVSDLLAGTYYAIANNATGTDCGGQVGGFTTAADGSGSAIPMINSPADFIVICREQPDTTFLPIMSGQLGKLGQPGAP